MKRAYLGLGCLTVVVFLLLIATSGAEARLYPGARLGTGEGTNGDFEYHWGLTTAIKGYDSVSSVAYEVDVYADSTSTIDSQAEGNYSLGAAPHFFARARCYVAATEALATCDGTIDYLRIYLIWDGGNAGENYVDSTTSVLQVTEWVYAYGQYDNLVSIGGAGGGSDAWAYLGKMCASGASGCTYPWTANTGAANTLGTASASGLNYPGTYRIAIEVKVTNGGTASERIFNSDACFFSAVGFTPYRCNEEDPGYTTRRIGSIRVSTQPSATDFNVYDKTCTNVKPQVMLDLQVCGVAKPATPWKLSPDLMRANNDTIGERSYDDVVCMDNYNCHAISTTSNQIHVVKFVVNTELQIVTVESTPVKILDFVCDTAVCGNIIYDATMVYADTAKNPKRLMVFWTNIEDATDTSNNFGRSVWRGVWSWNGQSTWTQVVAPEKILTATPGSAGSDYGKPESEHHGDRVIMCSASSGDGLESKPLGCFLMDGDWSTSNYQLWADAEATETVARKPTTCINHATGDAYVAYPAGSANTKLLHFIRDTNGVYTLGASNTLPAQMVQDYPACIADADGVVYATSCSDCDPLKGGRSSATVPVSIRKLSADLSTVLWERQAPLVRFSSEDPPEASYMMKRIGTNYLAVAFGNEDILMTAWDANGYQIMEPTIYNLADANHQEHAFDWVGSTDTMLYLAQNGVATFAEFASTESFRLNITDEAEYRTVVNYTFESDGLRKTRVADVPYNYPTGPYHVRLFVDSYSAVSQGPWRAWSTCTTEAECQKPAKFDRTNVATDPDTGAAYTTTLGMYVEEELQPTCTLTPSTPRPVVNRGEDIGVQCTVLDEWGDPLVEEYLGVRPQAMKSGTLTDLGQKWLRTDASGVVDCAIGSCFTVPEDVDDTYAGASAQDESTIVRENTVRIRRDTGVEGTAAGVWDADDDYYAVEASRSPSGTMMRGDDVQLDVKVVNSRGVYITSSGGTTSESDDFNTGVASATLWQTLSGVSVESDCNGMSPALRFLHTQSSSTAETVVFDALGKERMEVTYDLHAGDGFCYGDGSTGKIEFQYSVDGATWVTHTVHDDSCCDFNSGSKWKTFTATIPVNELTSTTKFRWTRTETGDTFLLDNVVVEMQDGISVTFEYTDGSDVVWETKQGTFDPTTNVARASSTIPNNVATGTAATYVSIPATEIDAKSNTLHRVKLEPYTLSSTITIESVEANATGGNNAIEVFNRGETVTVSGCLKHADGGILRKKMPSGTDEARTITVQAYLNEYGSSQSMQSASTVSVGPSACTWTTTVDIPTTATETYNETGYAQASADGLNWDVRVYQGGTTTSNENGIDGNKLSVFDVDATYYLSSDFTQWDTLMRDDVQRVTASLLGVRGQAVPDGTSVWVAILDSLPEERESGPRATTSGTTAHYDYTVPYNTRLNAWKATYNVTANATNDQNSMSVTDGAPWTVSKSIGITSFGVDVAGESTSDFFNRGEIIRYEATITHADGNAYRKLLADGTNTSRQVKFHAYDTSIGEGGSFTSPAATVDTVSGVVTATSTDVAVADGASDTYDSSVITLLLGDTVETKDWNVMVYEGADDGGNANTATQANVLDVDGNYYVSSDSIQWVAVMRGDEQRGTITLKGVRGQPAPETVRVMVNVVDSGGNVVDTGVVDVGGRGLTLPFDYEHPQDALRGAGWKFTYAVVANATNHQNSLSAVDGTAWTLSSVITVFSDDINVAGQSTTPFFNRNETVRVTARIQHADGNPYRKLKADGSNVSRTVDVHAYTGARGETGSFLSSAVAVDPLTGDFTTDVQVPSTATDTYASTGYGVDETKNWDFIFMEGGQPTLMGDVGGNYVNLTDRFDVDSNYYYKNHTLTFTDALMRGDTQRVHAAFVNVRGAAVPDGTQVIVGWYDGANFNLVGDITTTTDGVTSISDWTHALDDMVGTAHVRFIIDVDGTGNYKNSLAETSENATNQWVLNNTVGITVETQTQGSTDAFKTYNRGEAVSVTGTLTHADGGVYRVKSPTGTSARTVNLHAYRGGADSALYAQDAWTASNVAVSSTDGSFATSWTIPTSVTDTYGSASPRVADALLDYTIRAYGDGATQTSDEYGNHGESTQEFDVDATYYVQSDFRQWATVMRNDEQRVRATIVDAQDTPVPEGTSVWVAILDSLPEERESGARTTTSGTTANYDYTVPYSTRLNSWKATYNVTANATNDQNSMSVTDGTSWTVSKTIGITSFDVDVAGLSTSDYFNRGEMVRYAATLTHADGGAYRKLLADGTTTTRQVQFNAYQNTVGEAGGFLSPLVGVNASGVVDATATDVQVSTSATDTYVNATYGAAEAKDWTVIVVEGATNGGNSNAATIANAMDVDANYYFESDDFHFLGPLMRGDTQRVNASFVNVRGVDVPDGTLVEVLFYDDESNHDHTVYTTTLAGNVTDANYDIPVDWKISAGATTGTAKAQYRILASEAANLQNGMAETDASQTVSTFTLSSLIAHENVVVNPVAGVDAFKAFNRGESVVVTGTLKHADAGPYRVVNANGTDERYPRNVTVQLWRGTDNTTYGVDAFEATNVQVNQSTGYFETTLTLPTTLTDTYASTSWRIADGTNEYSVRVYDEGGNTTSDKYGNNGQTASLFDADAQYYYKNHTLTFTDALMLGDTQRVYAGFVNARDVPVPDDTQVWVNWYDGANFHLLGDVTTTTNGITYNSDWTHLMDDIVGTAHVRFHIDEGGIGNHKNSMAATAENTTNQWVLSNDITAESYGTNTTAGGNTLKAYNKGEDIVVSGCFKHADGGVLRVKTPSGSQARTITTQLYHVGNGIGSTGYVQSDVSVGPASCEWTNTLTLPSNAPDTYTSSVSAQDDGAYGWGLRAYDLTTDAASATWGNNVQVTGVFDADASVYLDRYYQGRNDTDAVDIDFNTGTNHVLNPDSDFTRLYVKNVRGELTNQFNNLKVMRTQVDPHTGAEVTDFLATLTNTGSNGYYRYAWGAWPAWTNMKVVYDVYSTDTNSNFLVLSDSAPDRRVGEAHHLIARARVQDSHVLRTQTVNVTVDVVDSYDDWADNGVFDLSAGLIQDGTLSGRWTDYHDNGGSYDFNTTYADQSSPFLLTHTYPSTATLGHRDLYLTVQGGQGLKFLGVEYGSAPGLWNHHARMAPAPSGLGAPVWLITNATDWEQHGYVTRTAHSNTLGVLDDVGVAEWRSEVHDSGATGAWAGATCSVTVSTGRVDAWLNTSDDNFLNTVGSATASLTTSNTLALPTPADGRYAKLTLRLEGDASVSECSVPFTRTSPHPTLLSDQKGSWQVDDIKPSMVTVDKSTYDLNLDNTVDAYATYAYVQQPGTVENETYAGNTLKLYTPANVLASVPAYSDAHTLVNASTNRTGYVLNTFNLTTIAQVGSPWKVVSETYSSPSVQTTFEVKARISDFEWQAKANSNESGSWVPALKFQRGEWARILFNITNNPENHDFVNEHVDDDVDTIVLSDTVAYDTTKSRYTASWIWPTNTTANYGTLHQPTIYYQINGYNGGNEIETPVELYSNFTVANIWHALTPNVYEESDVFVSGSHLMWAWANQRNVRNEPYDREANFTWTAIEPETGSSIGLNPSIEDGYTSAKSANHGSEPEFNEGRTTPHIRTGKASIPAVAPTGQWFVTASATDAYGNNATRTEEVTFLSSINPWSFKCTGASKEYEVGQNLNVSCYFVEKQQSGEDIPVEPQKTVYIQFFSKTLNDPVLYNLTPRTPMSLAHFKSNDTAADSLYGDRKALAYYNYQIPWDVSLYINKGLGYRIDTVYNGLPIDEFTALQVEPGDELYRLVPATPTVMKPGAAESFTVRSVMNHPVVGTIPFGPDSCGTSHSPGTLACIGDQKGVPRIAIKAINPACNCWASYLDPNNPVNDGTNVVAVAEMEKDYRYTKSDGSWAYTYTYNWTAPGSLSGQEFYVVYVGEYFTKNVSHFSPMMVDTFGGADPLKVMAPPQAVYVGEPVKLNIHSSYLNATARTGASASLYVYVWDPSGASVVAGANPVEISDGFYRYTYTPTVRGQYEVLITTPSPTGGVESATSTFWVDYNPFQNFTRIENDLVTLKGATDVLEGLVKAFWSQNNDTWEAWNGTFSQYQTDESSLMESKWASWNETFAQYNTSIRLATWLQEENLTSLAKQVWVDENLTWENWTTGFDAHNVSLRLALILSEQNLTGIVQDQSARANGTWEAWNTTFSGFNESLRLAMWLSETNLSGQVLDAWADENQTWVNWGTEFGLFEGDIKLLIQGVEDDLGTLIKEQWSHRNDTWLSWNETFAQYNVSLRLALWLEESNLTTFASEAWNHTNTTWAQWRERFVDYESTQNNTSIAFNETVRRALMLSETNLTTLAKEQWQHTNDTWAAWNQTFEAFNESMRLAMWLEETNLTALLQDQSTRANDTWVAWNGTFTQFEDSLRLALVLSESNLTGIVQDQSARANGTWATWNTTFDAYNTSLRLALWLEESNLTGLVQDQSARANGTWSAWNGTFSGYNESLSVALGLLEYNFTQFMREAWGDNNDTWVGWTQDFSKFNDSLRLAILLEETNLTGILKDQSARTNGTWAAWNGTFETHDDWLRGALLLSESNLTSIMREAWTDHNLTWDNWTQAFDGFNSSLRLALWLEESNLTGLVQDQSARANGTWAAWNSTWEAYVETDVNATENMRAAMVLSESNLTQFMRESWTHRNSTWEAYNKTFAGYNSSLRLALWLEEQNLTGIIQDQGARSNGTWAAWNGTFEDYDGWLRTALLLSESNLTGLLQDQSARTNDTWSAYNDTFERFNESLRLALWLEETNLTGLMQDQSARANGTWGEWNGTFNSHDEWLRTALALSEINLTGVMQDQAARANGTWLAWNETFEAYNTSLHLAMWLEETNLTNLTKEVWSHTNDTWVAWNQTWSAYNTSFTNFNKTLRQALVWSESNLTGLVQDQSARANGTWAAWNTTFDAFNVSLRMALWLEEQNLTGIFQDQSARTNGTWSAWNGTFESYEDALRAALALSESNLTGLVQDQSARANGTWAAWNDTFEAFNESLRLALWLEEKNVTQFMNESWVHRNDTWELWDGKFNGYDNWVRNALLWTEVNLTSVVQEQGARANSTWAAWNDTFTQYNTSLRLALWLEEQNLTTLAKQVWTHQNSTWEAFNTTFADHEEDVRQFNKTLRMALVLSESNLTQFMREHWTSENDSWAAWNSTWLSWNDTWDDYDQKFGRFNESLRLALWMQEQNVTSLILDEWDHRNATWAAWNQTFADFDAWLREATGVSEVNMTTLVESFWSHQNSTWFARNQSFDDYNRSLRLAMVLQEQNITGFTDAFWFNQNETWGEYKQGVDDHRVWLRTALVLSESNLTQFMNESWTHRNQTWQDWEGTFNGFNRSLRLALWLEETNLTGLVQDQSERANGTWDAWNGTFDGFESDLRLALALSESNLTGLVQDQSARLNGTWAAWNETFNGFNQSLRLAMWLEEQNLTGILQDQSARANGTWSAWNGSFESFDDSLRLALVLLESNLTGGLQYQNAHLNGTWAAWDETFTGFNNSMRLAMWLEESNLTGLFQDESQRGNETWAAWNGRFDTYEEALRAALVLSESNLTQFMNVSWLHRNSTWQDWTATFDGFNSSLRLALWLEESNLTGILQDQSARANGTWGAWNGSFAAFEDELRTALVLSEGNLTTLVKQAWTDENMTWANWTTTFEGYNSSLRLALWLEESNLTGILQDQSARANGTWSAWNGSFESYEDALRLALVLSESNLTGLVQDQSARANGTWAAWNTTFGGFNESLRLALWMEEQNITKFMDESWEHRNSTWTAWDGTFSTYEENIRLALALSESNLTGIVQDQSARANGTWGAWNETFDRFNDSLRLALWLEESNLTGLMQDQSSRANGTWEAWNGTFIDYEEALRAALVWSETNLTGLVQDQSARANGTWGAWNTTFTKFNESMRLAIWLEESNLTGILQDQSARANGTWDAWNGSFDSYEEALRYALIFSESNLTGLLQYQSARANSTWDAWNVKFDAYNASLRLAVWLKESNLTGLVQDQSARANGTWGAWNGSFESYEDALRLALVLSESNLTGLFQDQSARANTTWDSWNTKFDGFEESLMYALWLHEFNLTELMSQSWNQRNDTWTQWTLRFDDYEVWHQQAAAWMELNLTGLMQDQSARTNGTWSAYNDSFMKFNQSLRMALWLEEQNLTGLHQDQSSKANETWASWNVTFADYQADLWLALEMSEQNLTTLAKERWEHFNATWNAYNETFTQYNASLRLALWLEESNLTGLLQDQSARANDTWAAYNTSFEGFGADIREAMVLSEKNLTTLAKQKWRHLNDTWSAWNQTFDAYNTSLRLALWLEESNLTGILQDQSARANGTWLEWNGTFASYVDALRTAMVLSEENLTTLVKEAWTDENMTWANWTTTFDAFNTSLRMAMWLEEQNLTGLFQDQSERTNTTWTTWNGRFDTYEDSLRLALVLSESNLTQFMKESWTHRNQTWDEWREEFQGFNASLRMAMWLEEYNLTGLVQDQSARVNGTWDAWNGSFATYDGWVRGALLWSETNLTGMLQDQSARANGTWDAWNDEFDAYNNSMRLAMWLEEKNLTGLFQDQSTRFNDTWATWNVNWSTWNTEWAGFNNSLRLAMVFSETNLTGLLQDQSARANGTWAAWNTTFEAFDQSIMLALWLEESNLTGILQDQSARANGTWGAWNASFGSFEATLHLALDASESNLTTLMKEKWSGDNQTWSEWKEEFRTFNASLRHAIAMEESNLTQFMREAWQNNNGTWEAWNETFDSFNSSLRLSILLSETNLTTLAKEQWKHRNDTWEAYNKTFNAFEANLRLAMVLSESNITDLAKEEWALSNDTWTAWNGHFSNFEDTLAFAQVAQENNITQRMTQQWSKQNGTWEAYNNTFDAFNQSLRMALLLEESNLTNLVKASRGASDATWESWNGTFEGFNDTLRFALLLSESNVTTLLKHEWATTNGTWAAWNDAFAGYNNTNRLHLLEMESDLVQALNITVDGTLASLLPDSVNASVNGTVAYWVDNGVTRLKLGQRDVSQTIINGLGNDLLETRDNVSEVRRWQEYQSTWDAQLEEWKLDLFRNVLYLALFTFLGLLLTIMRGNKAAKAVRERLTLLAKLGSVMPEGAGIALSTEKRLGWKRKKAKRAGSARSPVRGPAPERRAPGTGKRIRGGGNR